MDNFIPINSSILTLPGLLGIAPNNITSIGEDAFPDKDFEDCEFIIYVPSTLDLDLEDHLAGNSWGQLFQTYTRQTMNRSS